MFRLVTAFFIVFFLLFVLSLPAGTEPPPGSTVFRVLAR
jgi:hypothetical protein